MPCFRLFTSLTKDKIPSDFVQKIVPLLARTLKKPEHKFVILVSPDCMVSFGNTVVPSPPGAVATLESLGALGLQENQVITTEVTNLVQKELGIAPDNFFLTFYDLQGQNIGKGGKLLA